MHGEYKLYGEFAISNQFIPVKIKISGNHTSAAHEIDKEYLAPLIESPDRVKRSEVYERIWERVEMGKLELLEGKQYISIIFPEITGACDLELKALYLEMVTK